MRHGGRRACGGQSGGQPDGGTQVRPSRLSSPRVFLLRMLVFLILAGFVALILYRQIASRLHGEPRPQQPDPRRAAHRHRARPAAGDAADTRDPLGQRPSPAPASPARPPAPCSSPPWRRCFERRRGAALHVHHDAAHGAGFDRHTARRIARDRPLPDRPADLPRPARHLLGSARDGGVHFQASSSRCRAATATPPSCSTTSRTACRPPSPA